MSYEKIWKVLDNVKQQLSSSPTILDLIRTTRYILDDSYLASELSIDHKISIITHTNNLITEARQINMLPAIAMQSFLEDLEEICNALSSDTTVSHSLQIKI